jgi:hypothetical protein
LPFGAIKGEDGVPIPDMQERAINIDGQEMTIRNYEGLKLAFELSARGKSDREIAIALNASGYRTTGTHGSRPFSRDTVKDMVVNKFYIGYISDGNGGWIKAKHEPFIEQGLFDATQNMRRKNIKSSHRHSLQGRTVYSLTGITFCWHCREKGREGRIHIACVKDSKPRLGCYNRAKGWDCPQKSAFLEIYEQQVKAYLDIFHIPEDYQEQILELHKKLQDNYDVEKEQKQLKSKLHRLKELYKWGDISKDEYTREKEQILSELQKLTPFQVPTNTLGKLAEFLRNVTSAWDEATPEQRNKLARCLFQEIWVKDKDVVAIKPQPEFEPFFRLNWEEFSKSMKSGGQPPSGSLIQIFC